MDDYQNQYDNTNEEQLPKKRSKGSMTPLIIIISIICGCIMFLGFWYILFSQFFGNLFGAISSPGYQESYITGNTIDVIYVEGTISQDSSTYHHDWTLNKIDSLMDSAENKAILLYVNSPGGGIYESDELYLKLKEYKEVTQRPVYAYMGQTAASGGLYVSMAADKILANRMTMTGSIGVIMSLVDTTGLQNLIGIKEEHIMSGKNKAMGNPLTDEQRAILQGLIDENYEIFVDIIVENRKLDRNKVYELADGRVYSPNQAKALGLIDDITTYDEAIEALITEHGLQECTVVHQTPPVSTFQELLANVSTGLEDGKVLSNFGEIKKYIENNQGLKLMYYMD